MYTGIVQGAFTVIEVVKKTGLHSLIIELTDALVEELAIGASVAVDGVCLTVTVIDGLRISFDVMQETLSLTTLGGLVAGSRVNVERSAKQGVEVGGHIISGHVDGTAEVVAIESPENNHFVTYRVPAEQMKYIFQKGFIGLNGCSLTVAKAEKDQCTLTVCYIPETLRVTTHGAKCMGDTVNFEVDRQTQSIVETVERFLAENPALLSHSSDIK